MNRLKQALGRLTPTVVISITAGALAALAAFHITLSLPEQASVVAFAGAAAIIIWKIPTVESVIALATAGIGVAVAFGLPVSSAQRESIIGLIVVIGGLVLGKHTVATVKARKRLVGVPFKTGRRPPKNAPALLLAKILTGVVPAHPATADHFGKLAFGLYANDKYGVCGPTGVANLVRLITGGLLGAEIVPSQEDVYDLYRRSGNPNFNPATDADDNGVDMQTMLEALLSGGIGDGKGGTVKPVAFAKVNVNSDAELEAAVAIFGGVLWGVNLQTAQQAQTNSTPAKWDYSASTEWGGHAVLEGAYETGQLEDVISWAMRVETTERFRAQQLEEAWVVIWPWNLDHPAFQEGVDIIALAAAYLALTGKTLPTPAPTPAPVPGGVASQADIALWESVKGWAGRRHSSTTKPIAAALQSWANIVGLS